MRTYEDYVLAWRRARLAWMAYEAGVPDAREAEDPGTLLTEREWDVLMDLVRADPAIGSPLLVPTSGTQDGDLPS